MAAVSPMAASSFVYYNGRSFSINAASGGCKSLNNADSSPSCSIILNGAPRRSLRGTSSVSAFELLYGYKRGSSKKPSWSSVCSRRMLMLRCQAVQDTKEAESNTAEEITHKYGLEAGLWRIFSSKDSNGNDSYKKSRTDEAKELLAKYGGAYLATSISLSLVSFGLCYVLVSAGVDVQGLLQKIGITAGETGEKVGTFALAYAAHKAASPIRFPPTVALTPMVASWIGKNGKKEEGP